MTKPTSVSPSAMSRGHAVSGLVQAWASDQATGFTSPF